ncbi:uncharacterized protein LOC128884252 isoform X2 [Hylaeus volcanicus]|uniref:uncharacterized protein LOC128884252 isoform X2 n=1 Tax=Hylaeus volcanicus TaxID=313075 RepID=UPI0023B78071|nr:uncharacterized protein LOC128884252 isoform X2 [Hylaeus volcanicus]
MTVGKSRDDCHLRIELLNNAQIEKIENFATRVTTVENQIVSVLDAHLSDLRRLIDENKALRLNLGNLNSRISLIDEENFLSKAALLDITERLNEIKSSLYFEKENTEILKINYEYLPIENFKLKEEKFKLIKELERLRLILKEQYLKKKSVSGSVDNEKIAEETEQIFQSITSLQQDVYRKSSKLTELTQKSYDQDKIITKLQDTVVYDQLKINVSMKQLTPNPPIVLAITESPNMGKTPNEVEPCTKENFTEIDNGGKKGTVSSQIKRKDTFHVSLSEQLDKTGLSFSKEKQPPSFSSSTTSIPTFVVPPYCLMPVVHAYIEDGKDLINKTMDLPGFSNCYAKLERGRILLFQTTQTDSALLTFSADRWRITVIFKNNLLILHDITKKNPSNCHLLFVNPLQNLKTWCSGVKKSGFPVVWDNNGSHEILHCHEIQEFVKQHCNQNQNSFDNGDDTLTNSNSSQAFVSEEKWQKKNCWKKTHNLFSNKAFSQSNMSSLNSQKGDQQRHPFTGHRRIDPPDVFHAQGVINVKQLFANSISNNKVLDSVSGNATGKNMSVYNKSTTLSSDMNTEDLSINDTNENNLNTVLLGSSSKKKTDFFDQSSPVNSQLSFHMKNIISEDFSHFQEILQSESDFSTSTEPLSEEAVNNIFDEKLQQPSTHENEKRGINVKSSINPSDPFPKTTKKIPSANGLTDIFMTQQKNKVFFPENSNLKSDSNTSPLNTFGYTKSSTYVKASPLTFGKNLDKKDTGSDSYKTYASTNNGKIESNDITKIKKDVLNNFFSKSMESNVNEVEYSASDKMSSKEDSTLTQSSETTSSYLSYLKPSLKKVNEDSRAQKNNFFKMVPSNDTVQVSAEASDINGDPPFLDDFFEGHNNNEKRQVKKKSDKVAYNKKKSRSSRPLTETKISNALSGSTPLKTNKYSDKKNKTQVSRHDEKSNSQKNKVSKSSTDKTYDNSESPVRSFSLLESKHATPSETSRVTRLVKKRNESEGEKSVLEMSETISSKSSNDNVIYSKNGTKNKFRFIFIFNDGSLNGSKKLNTSSQLERKKVPDIQESIEFWDEPSKDYETCIASLNLSHGNTLDVTRSDRIIKKKSGALTQQQAMFSRDSLQMISNESQLKSPSYETKISKKDTLTQTDVGSDQQYVLEKFDKETMTSRENFKIQRLQQAILCDFNCPTGLSPTKALLPKTFNKIRLLLDSKNSTITLQKHVLSDFDLFETDQLTWNYDDKENSFTLFYDTYNATEPNKFNYLQLRPYTQDDFNSVLDHFKKMKWKNVTSQTSDITPFRKVLSKPPSHESFQKDWDMTANASIKPIELNIPDISQLTHVDCKTEEDIDETNDNPPIEKLTKITFEPRDCVFSINPKDNEITLTRNAGDRDEETFTFKTDNEDSFEATKSDLIKNSFVFNQQVEKPNNQPTRQVCIVEKGRIKLYKKYINEHQEPTFEFHANEYWGITNAVRKEIFLCHMNSDGTVNKKLIDCFSNKVWKRWYTALLFGGFIKDITPDDEEKLKSLNLLVRYVFPIRFFNFQEYKNNPSVRVTENGIDVYALPDDEKPTMTFLKNHTQIFSDLKNRRFRLFRYRYTAKEEQCDLLLNLTSDFDIILANLEKYNFLSTNVCPMIKEKVKSTTQLIRAQKFSLDVYPVPETEKPHFSLSAFDYIAEIKYEESCIRIIIRPRTTSEELQTAAAFEKLAGGFKVRIKKLLANDFLYQYFLFLLLILQIWIHGALLFLSHN